MTKKISLLLTLCFVFFFNQAQEDSLKLVYDNFFNQAKLRIDSVKSDSLALSEVNALLTNSRNISHQLIESLEAKDTLSTATQTPAATSDDVSGFLKMDEMHMYYYAGIGLIFILFIIFLIAFFSVRKKYHGLSDEIYDMEEILDKFSDKKIGTLKKLEGMFKKYNDINSRIESVESDKLNVEENLSFVKVENTKLIEKNEELERQLEGKDSIETESINKILELEKIIEHQRKEIIGNDSKIKELENIAQDSGMISQLSDDKKAELNDLDFNITKLEKLNKLRESNTISDEEFKELKKKIIDKL